MIVLLSLVDFGIRTLRAVAPGFTAELRHHATPLRNEPVRGLNLELTFLWPNGNRADAAGRLSGRGALDLRGGAVAFPALSDGTLPLDPAAVLEVLGPWIDALLAWHFQALAPGEYTVTDAPDGVPRWSELMARGMARTNPRRARRGPAPKKARRR